MHAEAAQTVKPSIAARMILPVNRDTTTPRSSKDNFPGYPIARWRKCTL
ncbi:hypothetical protein HMPREF0591_3477 [Mycobacterium parascrofulaceum ATCC BAA-614]|uniref:Uncharacterized protein n=1 Tax=Mycobacterium parascrofulaceum ATCC BAA-614 TaxID=525368 RepID=D5PBD3_9MYCO|nr:hypothetical protein HMPREF0591_3477 [Mycobacterium parascrofulaceum ATCC BAA-614]